MNLNATLHHDSLLNYPNWTKKPIFNTYAINVPGDDMGLIQYPESALSTPKLLLTNDSVIAVATSQVDLIIEVSKQAGGGATGFFFEVKRSDGFWANGNGEWQNSSYFVNAILQAEDTSGTFTLKFAPVPADCTITVTICTTIMQYYIGRTVEIHKCALINNFNYDGRIGEFHTVQRLNAPSSIIKENQEVFNGDSFNIIFDGAIYKSDQVTLTEFWTRKGKLEEKNLLRISAEDDMRIQQNSVKTFTGEFYGEIPYLSIIEINNISGLFMFIEYNFDTDTNITKGKLQQFYTNEVPDLNYILTFDFGNTVKPSIRS
jgi:hypothetical protein